MGQQHRMILLHKVKPVVRATQKFQISSSALQAVNASVSLWITTTTTNHHTAALFCLSFIYVATNSDGAKPNLCTFCEVKIILMCENQHFYNFCVTVLCSSKYNFILFLAKKFFSLSMFLCVIVCEKQRKINL